MSSNYTCDICDEDIDRDGLDRYICFAVSCHDFHGDALIDSRVFTKYYCKPCVKKRIGFFRPYFSEAIMNELEGK